MSDRRPGKKGGEGAVVDLVTGLKSRREGRPAVTPTLFHVASLLVLIPSWRGLRRAKSWVRDGGSPVLILSAVQLLSHVCLFSTLWARACQAPLSMGFSRQEYWSGLPFPPPEELEKNHPEDSTHNAHRVLWPTVAHQQVSVPSRYQAVQGMVRGVGPWGENGS